MPRRREEMMKALNVCFAVILVLLIYTAARSLAAEVFFVRYRFETQRLKGESRTGEKALGEISRAVAAEPQNVTFLNEKAYLLLSLAGVSKDFEKRLEFADRSLSIARRSVAIAPGYWESWRVLALSLKALGMEAESRAAMKRAEELSPKGP